MCGDRERREREACRCDGFDDKRAHCPERQCDECESSEPGSLTLALSQRERGRGVHMPPQPSLPSRRSQSAPATITSTVNGAHAALHGGRCCPTASALPTTISP